jgi:hypothetical protein
MGATSDTVLVSGKYHLVAPDTTRETKTAGTQKSSKAPVSHEAHVFTGFQAQKRRPWTSLDGVMVEPGGGEIRYSTDKIFI